MNSSGILWTLRGVTRPDAEPSNDVSGWFPHDALTHTRAITCMPGHAPPQPGGRGKSVREQNSHLDFAIRLVGLAKSEYENRLFAYGARHRVLLHLPFSDSQNKLPFKLYECGIVAIVSPALFQPTECIAKSMRYAVRCNSDAPFRRISPQAWMRRLTGRLARACLWRSPDGVRMPPHGDRTTSTKRAA